jgi:hypothetical protein
MTNNSATASLKPRPASTRANSVDPPGGNGFDVLLAADHECERVERMSGPIDAMAAWFATPSMSRHQRPRQSVGGGCGDGPGARVCVVSTRWPRVREEALAQSSDSNCTIRIAPKQDLIKMLQAAFCILSQIGKLTANALCFNEASGGLVETAALRQIGTHGGQKWQS